MNTKKEEASKLKIIQLTDIHIDFDYMPESISSCPNRICCRAKSPRTPSSKNLRAGFWGSSNKCDIPIWLVENMFEHIATNEQVKYKIKFCRKKIIK